MRRLAIILALVLAALAVQTSSVFATHWCGGATEQGKGTNFGACPGPAH